MQLVPVTLPNGYEGAGAWSRTVWLRPWRGADEIAVSTTDVAALPPAARVTALLARCVYVAEGARPAGRAFVRALTAGDREALLLHLRRITLGDRLSCVLSCRACGSLMDLDLQASDLLVAPSAPATSLHEARIVTASGSIRVSFRLPTGADQEEVVALARRDPASAARIVAERCIDRIDDDTTGAERPLSDDIIESIGEAMIARDPQAQILLDAACPGCGARAATLFDAAAYIFQEMARHVHTLLRQVHVLASHYHWSERHILGLTARRRRTYLELIASAHQPEWRRV